jgi:hypothetical protein
MKPYRPEELTFSTKDLSCIAVFPMEKNPGIKINNKKYTWNEQGSLNPKLVIFSPIHNLVFSIG